VIERDTILNDIWGEDVHVYSRSVDTHVSKLRKKLESVSVIIESVHGAGYKFNPSNH
jgi:two-component system phosphate regulon response regulator PhoB